MDEILASIRRIIAEEPIGSRAPPAAGPTVPGPALPAPQSPAGNAAANAPEKPEEPKSAPRGRLSDALQAASPEARPAAGRPQPDDDPLDGLIEPENGSPAAAAAPGRPVAAPAQEETRGPLWFLKRKAEALDAPASGPAAPGTPPADGRGALPPLFGSPAEPVLPRKADRVKPLDLDALKHAVPEPRPEASPDAGLRDAPAAAAEREVVTAAPAPSPAPAAPAVEPVQPAPASAVPLTTTTLEDTVAELLRPMLRQWLDANMPRIVEKALKGELSQRQNNGHNGGRS